MKERESFLLSDCLVSLSGQERGTTAVTSTTPPCRAEISYSRMKVTSSTQRERVKSAEKAKLDGGELKSKGWRKAVEEDGSQVSDLSDSTDDGAEEDESLGERSEDYENFEKTLRSKHSKACKAMSVCSFFGSCRV